MKRKARCLECGSNFETGHQGEHVFCQGQCRKNFNNRRAKRGAILYDLFMANRFERDEASDEKVLSAMSRLASDWKHEDDQQRGQRPSWGNWRRFLRANPHLRSSGI